MVNIEKRRFLRMLVISTLVLFVYALFGKKLTESIFSNSASAVLSKDESVTVKVEDGALVVE